MKWTVILAALALFGCASPKKQTLAETPRPRASGVPSSVASAASSASAKTSEMVKISCKKDAEIRTLEVVTTGSGCALDYNKAGKTASVASSSHGSKHCIESQKKLRSKLEKAGFSCA